MMNGGANYVIAPDYLEMPVMMCAREGRVRYLPPRTTLTSAMIVCRLSQRRRVVFSEVVD